MLDANGGNLSRTQRETSVPSGEIELKFSTNRSVSLAEITFGLTPHYPWSLLEAFWGLAF